LTSSRRNPTTRTRTSTPSVPTGHSKVLQWFTAELLQEAQYNTIGVAANPDGTNQPFVCVVEQTFELECLDIAGASTLSNLVDQSSIFSTDYTGAEA